MKPCDSRTDGRSDEEMIGRTNLPDIRDRSDIFDVRWIIVTDVRTSTKKKVSTGIQGAFWGPNGFQPFQPVLENFPALPTPSRLPSGLLDWLSDVLPRGYMLSYSFLFPPSRGIVRWRRLLVELRLSARSAQC